MSRLPEPEILRRFQALYTYIRMLIDNIFVLIVVIVQHLGTILTSDRCTPHD